MNKESKKISVFIPSLRGGGAERMMLNLASELRNKGEDVWLVVAQEESDYVVPDILSDRVTYLDVSRIRKSLFPLMRYLRREKPDVLIATMTHANGIAILAKVLSWSDTQIIIREANTLSESVKGTTQTRRYVRLLVAFFFYWLADEIVAVSEGVANDLANTAKLSRERITVIRNPTITRAAIEKYQGTVTHPWFTDKKTPVILAVGRLHPQKDYPTLIRAFAHALKERELRLVILGEGPDRRGLERYIVELDVEKHVDVPGFVENPYAYMEQADLYVLSSRWEGLPNTLIEALGAGTPVVATDCPSGPREILEDGRYGTLVPVGDPDALSEAMLEELSRSRSANFLREYARTTFSAERAASAYLSLIR